MRSCDRSDSKNSGPIGHVLNGFYPEAAVGRMSQQGLERLVASLVRCTSRAVHSPPQWWPPTITYNSKINLGLDDEREVKLALKQLIVDCSQFFNNNRERAGDKWSVSWPNEPQRKKRPRRRPARPLLAAVPFVLLERPPPDQHRFLRYFRLRPQRRPPPPSPPPPPATATLKLANCVHVPFSSDVGRLMAARERHCMPEELKLKRLERSEWYINKGPAPRAAEGDLESGAPEPPAGRCHLYRMPRRQSHQRRPGFHDADFLARFCTPLQVRVERMDLEKASTGRRLLVMIGESEKRCCDAKARVVRTSPRLRSA